MKKAKQRLRVNHFCLKTTMTLGRRPINLNMVLIPTTGKKIGEIARRRLGQSFSMIECLGE